MLDEPYGDALIAGAIALAEHRGVPCVAVGEQRFPLVAPALQALERAGGPSAMGGSPGAGDLGADALAAGDAALPAGGLARRRAARQLPALLRDQRAGRRSASRSPRCSGQPRAGAAAAARGGPRRAAHRPRRRPAPTRAATCSACARPRARTRGSWSRRSSPRTRTSRADWPVAGTTGYEVGAALTGLAIDPHGLLILGPGRAPLRRGAARLRPRGDGLQGRGRRGGARAGRPAPRERAVGGLPGRDPRARRRLPRVPRGGRRGRWSSFDVYRTYATTAPEDPAPRIHAAITRARGPCCPRARAGAGPAVGLPGGRAGRAALAVRGDGALGAGRPRR